MAFWRPVTREPDALRAALLEYLRNRSPRVFLDASASGRPLGRTTVVMSDGSNLAIDVVVTLERAAAFSERAAIYFAISGHAANHGAGYEVAGLIVIDRKTLAFLLLDVTVSAVA
ncbi:hypothetical protein PY650_25200 [Rhizobium calliandrae]|uniref:Uncharacterized protein n=1 Tax=Rhizobium calliandrae TaxID=1312182 RepID=A0ABT7KNQ9_9HYPH|nr:hypothetical protein [Rhizobium calliandrae]MDL2408878.1 hypothetical protein [Rhizobium calliandrae]